MRSITLAGLGAITLALQIATPLPARADWQMTRWGMSEADVRAAVPGVRTNSDRSKDAPTQKALLASSYKALDLDLTAYFIFRDGELVQVDLEPVDEAQCEFIPFMLKSTYSAPDDVSDNPDMTILNWFDRERGNRVAYWRIGPTHCSIIYQPLPITGL